MRVKSYGDYLLQLTSLPHIFPSNCYLVREQDGFTLIDTTIAGQAPAILKIARNYGLPIRRLVLTHAHGDHLGSLDALHLLLPEAEVLVSARDSRFLEGDRSLDAGEPTTPLRGAYQTITTRPTRLLDNGDMVGSLRAISTPGHTPGHMAFFDLRDGTIIAGDAFQTRAGVAVSGTIQWLFPFPAMATWNRPLALNSARHIRMLTPTRLAVGHGEVLEQPLAAIDAAIAVAAQDVEEFVTHGT